MIACNSETQVSSSTNPEDQTEILSDTVNQSDTNQTTISEPEATPEFPVLSGKAVFNESYCQGAYPREEELQALHKYRTLTETVIRLVKHDDTTQVVLIKTDDQGQYGASLEPGKWDYYLTPDLPEKYAIDRTCKARFAKPYGEIRVSENTSTLPTLYFTFDCDPCDPGMRTLP